MAQCLAGKALGTHWSFSAAADSRSASSSWRRALGTGGHVCAAIASPSICISHTATRFPTYPLIAKVGIAVNASKRARHLRVAYLNSKVQLKNTSEHAPRATLASRTMRDREGAMFARCVWTDNVKLQLVDAFSVACDTFAFASCVAQR
jgi:hypothetical protein